MKMAVICFLSLLSIQAFALVPPGFTCTALDMTQADVDAHTSNFAFMIGKMASDNRSGTFEGVDPLTALAAKNFFYTADFISSYEFVSGQTCTKPIPDMAPEVEFYSEVVYRVNGSMSDVDYEFCPTQLEITEVQRGGLGSISQEIHAVYYPNIDPADKDLCAQADGSVDHGDQ